MQLADALRPNALQDNHDTFCHLWVGGRVTRMTYADLYDGGSRYAAALRSAGVQPDTLVLITLRHARREADRG